MPSSQDEGATYTSLETGAEVFWQSAALLKAWGQTRLSTGQTLAESLRLGDVSLWDSIAPYLSLYRLPGLLSTEGQPQWLRWHRRVWDMLRPYRGWAGRLRDETLKRERETSGISGCAQWPVDECTILFLGFWPLFYRETFQAAAERLAERDGIRTVVLGVTHPMPRAPSDALIWFNAIWGHADPYVQTRVVQLSKALYLTEGRLRHELPQIINSTGTSLWRAMRSEFGWLFRSEFPRLAQQIAVAEHILDNHRPALIISPDDADQRTRLYTLLARSRGIPSLVVQQGLTNEKGVEWQFFTADAVAVFGPTSRAALCQHGIPPDRIHVTGCPRFDILAQPAPLLTQEIRAALGVPDGSALVVMASQPYVPGAFSRPEARHEMLRAIGRAVGALENVHLAVKVHPVEDEGKVRELIGTGSRVSFVNRREDIQELIQACDVFITFFSTSGLMALIACKPLICVNFPDSGVSNLYCDSGAAWVTRTEEEIVHCLHILTGPAREQMIAEREAARQRFVYDLTYLPDGSATQRVSQTVLELIGQEEQGIESKHY